jgi:hypothetical protein
LFNRSSTAASCARATVSASNTARVKIRFMGRQ